MSRLKKEYEISQKIGQGGFGVVFRARCIAKEKRWYNLEVAIKKIDVTKAPDHRVDLELKALSALNHENIVKFYEQFREGAAQYIIMEFCKFKSLREHVKKNGRMCNFSAAYILRQLVSAVKYIHSQNIMHRDLSAGNVLISSIRDNKLFVKLADFGLATTFYKGDYARTMLGTPGYIAPQVYGRRYNEKADVFSLGGILYLMLAGEDPPRDGLIDSKLTKISIVGAELIQSMMDPSEERRMPLSDIKMSEFMREADDLSLPASRSREASLEKPYRDFQMHAMPIKARSHSAQPITKGYRRITKDSAFESGESANILTRGTNMYTYMKNSCGHYDSNVNNACVRCDRPADDDFGNEKSKQRQNFRDHVVFERPSRSETRNGIPHAETVKYAQPFVKESDSRKYEWPISIARISPTTTVHRAGRFIFKENGSLVFEATIRNRSQSACKSRNTNEDLLIKWIAIVEKIDEKNQLLSVCQPVSKTLIPRKQSPQLQLNLSTKRTYRSLSELQKRGDKIDEIAAALYQRMLDEVYLVGGRVAKITFKPSNECTARLMENGDFRIKYQDGRLGVRKKNSDSVQVTNEDKTVASFTFEEKRLFDRAYYDVIKMESALEGCPFQEIKAFPLFFSNSSRFFSNGEPAEVVPPRASERKYHSEKLASDVNSCPQPVNQKCYSADVIQRQSFRKPFQDVNDLARKQNPICTLRKLQQSEYSLMGSPPDQNGRQIPTRIISNRGGERCEVRVSSVYPDIFIYTENGNETRFKFDGTNYQNVPSAARDLLFTLQERRRQ